jgi:hypothetical protein
MTYTMLGRSVANRTQIALDFRLLECGPVTLLSGSGRRQRGEPPRLAFDIWPQYLVRPIRGEQES